MPFLQSPFLPFSQERPELGSPSRILMWCAALFMCCWVGCTQQPADDLQAEAKKTPEQVRSDAEKLDVPTLEARIQKYLAAIADQETKARAMADEVKQLVKDTLTNADTELQSRIANLKEQGATLQKEISAFQERLDIYQKEFAKRGKG